jgi:tetratricopeptide (TPR) repeat protein
MPRESDYPYARDRETFDSDLCVQVISGRVDPAFKEWKANPAWRPEETFRHLIAEPCREILKEFPGYKYASGIEFLLKLREARAAEWVLETPTKVGEPTKPVPLTAEQRRRAAALYREALELARKPETKLPTEFLTLTLREKDFYEHVQRPQKSVPMTAEEYVWFHRLGSIWGVPDGALDELQREVLARKDWRPTPMFLHRVLMATLPDDIIHSPDTPKETLIAHWMQADALFARIKAGVPRDSEDYRKVTDRFSATAIHIAGRFRAMGERGLAKQAMTRCIQFIEETPVRPDVQDWPYRTRCYFDRGNLHFDGGEWAAALADYQTCLKLSKQKPGEYDSLSIPGMNAVAQFRSGTALLRLNRFDEAERAFDEALQIRGAEMFESRPLKSGKPSVPWLVPVTEHDRANEYKLVGRWESAEKWAGRALKTLAENEDAYPVEQVNRYRFRLHSIRAQALDNLKDHEAAAKAWDVAREYGTAEELRLYAVLSAAAYAQVGRHEEVARRLEELAASGKLSAIEAYNAGCGFALCSIGAKVDKDLAAKYRNRAMEMLKKAVASGYANAEEMKADPDLIPLRDRADFKALVAELEKKF